MVQSDAHLFASALTIAGNPPLSGHDESAPRCGVPGLQPSQLIETLATEGTQAEDVILAIAKAEHRVLAAIAQAMREYRARLAWQRIVAAAVQLVSFGLFRYHLLTRSPLRGFRMA